MHGPRLRKLNPITCEEALDRRGDDGEEPKKASVDVVGGAVDDAVDVVREKAIGTFVSEVCVLHDGCENTSILFTY